MSKSNTCTHIEELISGYLDDELTQQEAQKVAIHLEQCQQCQQMYQQLQSLGHAVSNTSVIDIEPKKLDELVNDLTAKRIADISWFLIITGVVMAVVFAIYQFWLDTSMPWYSKLMVSLLWGGGIGLFISVLRQRLITRKTDKYNKVKL